MSACIIVLVFQLTVVGTHIPHCIVLRGFVCVIAIYRKYIIKHNYSMLWCLGMLFTVAEV